MSDETFFLLFAILSFFGTLLVVFHLMQPGVQVRTLGQRLRYLTLFLYAVTISYAGIELVHDHIQRDMRHTLYMLSTVSLIITMMVSIRDTSKEGKSK